MYNTGRGNYNMRFPLILNPFAVSTVKDVYIERIFGFINLVVPLFSAPQFLCIRPQSLCPSRT